MIHDTIGGRRVQRARRGVMRSACVSARRTRRPHELVGHKPYYTVLEYVPVVRVGQSGRDSVLFKSSAGIQLQWPAGSCMQY